MSHRLSRENSPHREAARFLSASLRDARARAGMSQQALAAKSAVSIGTVRAIETSTVIEPGFFTIVALAAALNIELVSLIDIEDPNVDGVTSSG